MTLEQANPPTTDTSRRRFLKTTAVGSAAAVAAGFPMISTAQTVTWRFQSTWPAQDIFHENATDYARMVNQLSGGRLRLDVLPAGAVVGALQMQDAVIAGALDGGHGVTGYWFGKHKAFSLFGTPPAYGWKANEMLGWFYYGGGEALYNELVQDILGLQLVGFLSGPMPTQALGWFKGPIRSADQMRGMRYRTVGLAADLMNEMGASVTILGGPDIVPALDRGLIEGAEFNNPSSDRVLGFQDVSKHWMLQSYHQDAESFEIIFNKRKYDGLPEELQSILRYAAYAASADMSWKLQDRYPKDLAALRSQHGVTTYRTPTSILQAQLEAWDKVIERSSQEEFFARVIESQREWVENVMGYFLDNDAPKDMAYEHFFGNGKRGLVEV